jgi:hypothetical protein
LLLAPLAASAAEPPTKRALLMLGGVTQILDADGKATWKYPAETRDGCVLPNGHVLLALARSKTYPGGAVVEVTGQDVVFACVGNDDDLRSVTLGTDGAFAGMAKGTIFVDHTTASAEVARDLYEKASALGVGFIDAPVSGGQAGAENGVLTVMCGGDADIFAKVEPLIMSFARLIACTTAWVLSNAGMIPSNRDNN